MTAPQDSDGQSTLGFCPGLLNCSLEALLPSSGFHPESVALSQAGPQVIPHLTHLGFFGALPSREAPINQSVPKLLAVSVVSPHRSLYCLCPCFLKMDFKLWILYD